MNQMQSVKVEYNGYRITAWDGSPCGWYWDAWRIGDRLFGGSNSDTGNAPSSDAAIAEAKSYIDNLQQQA